MFLHEESISLLKRKESLRRKVSIQSIWVPAQLYIFLEQLCLSLTSEPFSQLWPSSVDSWAPTSEKWYFEQWRLACHQVIKTVLGLSKVSSYVSLVSGVRPFGAVYSLIDMGSKEHPGKTGQSITRPQPCCHLP